MKATRAILVLLVAMWAVAVMGCTVFELSPVDVQQKLRGPTKGRLYERNPPEPF